MRRRLGGRGSTIFPTITSPTRRSSSSGRLSGFAAVALVSTILAAPSAQKNRGSETGDLVEIDVVALDRKDQPVGGLTIGDFQIKEDGRLVDLKTFAAVGFEEAVGRQLTLLLDDSSVPVNGTSVVQAMARAVLSRARPLDEVTVVRLNNDRDEAFGDFETAIARIDGYRAGAVPFQALGTGERAMRVIETVSRQLESLEHRRKVVVCIGGPRVCNVLEPLSHGYGLNWQVWVRAMAAAARANVAVYAAMPTQIGSPMMLSGGIADLTGGDGYINGMDFDRFIDSVWREASAYYLLGYWPTREREMHSIDVKALRKGVHVHARRRRG
jgi:VWFA-related protein